MSIGRIRAFLLPEAVQLLLEIGCWTLAWFILPFRLGAGHADGAVFALYAAGAGLLLAAGTLVDAEARLADFRLILQTVYVCSFSIFVVGGIVFLVARLVL